MHSVACPFLHAPCGECSASKWHTNHWDIPWYQYRSSRQRMGDYSNLMYVTDRTLWIPGTASAAWRRRRAGPESQAQTTGVTAVISWKSRLGAFSSVWGGGCGGCPGGVAHTWGSCGCYPGSRRSLCSFSRSCSKWLLIATCDWYISQKTRLEIDSGRVLCVVSAGRAKARWSGHQCV